jgi:hypothetical protein
MRNAVQLLLILCVSAWGSLNGFQLVPVQAELESSPRLDWAVLSRARLVAAGILVPAGVELQWNRKSTAMPCGRPSIVIGFTENTPPQLLPGAMAYALPYAGGGTRITLFLDRMAPLFKLANGSQAGILLGHVLAHEITHVLQGTARHSASGLMKARFSESDFQQMLIRPMPLTPDDTRLIRQALERCSTLSSGEIGQ